MVNIIENPATLTGRDLRISPLVALRAISTCGLPFAMVL